MSYIPLNHLVFLLNIDLEFLETIPVEIQWASFIIGILLPIGIFLFALSEKKNSQKIYKTSIQNSISEVKTIVAEIYNRVQKIDNNKLKFEDVARYFSRKSNLLEFYRFNIIVNKSHATKLSKKDVEIIEKSLETIDKLLDTYDRPDLPNHIKSDLWQEMTPWENAIRNIEQLPNPTKLQLFYKYITFGKKQS